MKRIILLISSVFLYAGLHAQITTAADGNWTNPATWVGGVVPTAADQVIIAPSHDIVMNANGACRTLTIETGGTAAMNGSLTINLAGGTLTVGDFNSGGGRDSVVVRGTLTISNGALNIGGRLRQYASPAQYTQTGGIVRIDGNTGSAATSVADADFLFRSDRNYVSGFTFTGGTLLFVDPTFGPSGNHLTTNTSGFTYLGANSHLQLGDGVSTTAGGSPQGFVLNGAAAYVAGNVTINNPSGTNRTVTNTGCIQMSNLTLIAGTLSNTVSVDILGAAQNDGTINQTLDIDFRSGLTNNGTITATRNFLVLGDLINNTGASITAPTVNITRDLVNNGTITATTTLGFARAPNNASTTAQVISGTGTFNTSTASLFLNNNNVAGVTLNTDLSVKQLSLATGKIFLGSSNVIINTITSGSSMGSATAYFVTNGTGRLKFTNLTAAEVLFSVGIGTSYLPVRIANGSGHTFSVGVQAGFTVPPPGTQHVLREWDIDDETGGAVNATVTLQWNAADEDPTFSRAACAVTHYTAGSWKKEGTTGAASGTNPYTKTATGVTSFSPFSVSSNLVVLPLTLKGFGATKEGERIRVNWQTEGETNASHYEVEKSDDGVRYSFLTRISARNSIVSNDYESYDHSPFRGPNYYRLKLVDKGGQSRYSTVVKIEPGLKNNLAIWPNPAKSEIVAQWNRKPAAVFVLDRIGRTVLQLLPSASNRYNVSSLTAGTYFLKLQAGDVFEMVPFIKY